MAFTILTIDLIVSDLAIRGGRPIIADTTVRVQDIAAHHRYRGYTAEELAAQLQLSLAQVHAALAYYYQHQAEIDGEIEAEDQRIREAKEKGFGQRHSPVL